jgi:hypothetical protein
VLLILPAKSAAQDMDVLPPRLFEHQGDKVGFRRKDLLADGADPGVEFVRRITVGATEDMDESPVLPWEDAGFHELPLEKDFAAEGT